MVAKSGMELNLQPLFSALYNLRSMDFVEEAFVGMAKEVLQSVFDSTPKVPIRSGRLSGSGTLHVNGKFVKDTLFMSRLGTPDFATGVAESIRSANTQKAFICFNTPYATYVHESQSFKYSAAGSGPFWLSTKLSRTTELASALSMRMRTTFQAAWQVGFKHITIRKAF